MSLASPELSLIGEGFEHERAPAGVAGPAFGFGRGAVGRTGGVGLDI